ncbi:glycoside hydrolase family 125 protein, partial [Acinetobacter baumannii]
ERDELQTLYIQQGINMLKLQKRVDAAIEAINEHYESDGMSGLYFMDLKEILEGEQALNGDQYDEHRKKAEEAISKGASLTNHRIEL